MTAFSTGSNTTHTPTQNQHHGLRPRVALRATAASLLAVALGFGALATSASAASAAGTHAKLRAAQARAASSSTHGPKAITLPAAVTPLAPKTQPTAAVVSTAKGDAAKKLGAAPQITTTAAATFSVDSTVDSPLKTATGTTCVDSETTPKCSLRAAVQAANNLDAPVDIDVPAGTFSLTDKTLGDLYVHNPGGTAIIGAGETSTTISVPTGNDYGVIFLGETTSGQGGALWLTDLSLSGGNAEDGGGLNIGWANDSAILNHVAVTHNKADEGGGIACGPNDEGGSLWATDSRITHNTAESGGGIYSYFCGIQLTDTSITSDNGTDDDGGGILVVYGALTVTGGQISTDAAGGKTTKYGYGGGIYNEYSIDTLNGTVFDHDTAYADTEAEGGGYFMDYGQLTATGVTFASDAASVETTANTTDSYGGGLYSDEGGQVAFHGSSINHCTAKGSTDGSGGGGIYDYEYYYSSLLTIDDSSTVSDNTGGGVVTYGYYGGSTVTVDNSTVDGNTSSIEYQGGGITDYLADYGGSHLTLDGDTIDGNSDSAKYSAGGVVAWAEEYAGLDLSMTADTVDTNTSNGEEGSGGLFAYAEEYSNVTASITGSTLDGNAAPDYGYGGAIDVYATDDYAPAELRLTNDVIDHNTAGSTATKWEGYGGGLFTYYYVDATISGTEIADNTAEGYGTGGTTESGGGGGWYTEAYQSATLTDDLITGNSATGPESDGGGIFSEDEAGLSISRSTISDNSAAYGAGDYQGSDGYSLRLADSTVSGNTASTSTYGAEGGGIYLDDSGLDTTNTTIADNTAATGPTATTPGEGGGIAKYGDYSVTLSFSTIAGNKAGLGGGVYEDGEGGTFKGSIVGGNTSSQPGATSPDCFQYVTKTTTTTPTFTTGASFSSSGHNVFTSNGCVSKLSFGDQVVSTAGLWPLAPNPGPNEATNPHPTQTMALKPASPALDAAGLTCPATDERGVARPQLTACDSGAYEATQGLWMVGSDGGVFSFGSANFYGSMGGQHLNAPVVGITSTPGGLGYWEGAADGGVFSYGNALFHGSMGGLPLNKPVVGIASTPTGKGYWEVASDGGVFSFGNAQFHGSTGALTLNAPIVAMTPTPTGGGYWLVAADGGVFCFGNAQFHGSMGGMTLNKPVVGMAATPTGGGYWEVASDGGLFSFGNAKFHGSTGGLTLNAPIVASVVTADGGGYTMVAADGGSFAFGNALYLGSLATLKLNSPIVGAASA